MDGVDDRGAVGDRTKVSAEWGLVVHEVELVAVASTMFCPTDHVTRGQMAAFLHRALGAR